VLCSCTFTLTISGYISFSSHSGIVGRDFVGLYRDSDICLQGYSVVVERFFNTSNQDSQDADISQYTG